MADEANRRIKRKVRSSNTQVLVILITGVLVVLGSLGFGRFSMALILPTMQAGLSLSHSEMGVMVTAAFLGYLSFSLGSGIAASAWGPRKVIALSLLVEGASLVATGMGDGFWSPLAWLALAGVGMAGANVPVMAMVSAWVPPQRRGLASGLLVSGSGFGLLINGYTIPHWLNQAGGQGWRTAWIWLGVMVLVIGLWSAIVLRDRPGYSGGKQAATVGKENKESIWVQIYRVWRTKPVLRKLGLVYFAFGFSYVIFTTFFGAYLTETRGWTTIAAGRLWSWVGIFSLGSGFLWGWVSDRLGRRWGLFLVYFLHGSCLVAFAVLPWDTGITVAALIYGLSIFSIPAIMNAACGDEVGPQLAPTAFGAVTVAFGLGQMAAPAVAGIMLDWGWGMVENLWLSALVAFLGAVGAAFLHAPFFGWLRARLSHVGRG